MALSFAVTNLGPLSGIGFGIKDVGTAVYIATNAYGWYNSRARAVSLEQILASSGVSLVTSFNFNKDVYLAIRKDHNITWGIGRSVSNVISRFRLPRASTATEGSDGILCLRSVIIGLLCFVDQQQVPYILIEILPSRLFHYEQQGKEITVNGPYLAALVQYVRSVDTEEGADELRAHILRHVDSQLHRVTCATLADLRDSEKTEVGHMIGLLDWLLTPISKRQTNLYRTRSLRVWCLALVLSDLGFEVEAERTAVTSPPDTPNLTMEDEYYSGEARVVLMLAPGWSTDRGRKLSDNKNDVVNEPIFPAGRVISVRSLPSIVFTDHASSALKRRSAADAKALEDAFIGTYLFVRHRLSSEKNLRHAARLEGPVPIDRTKYADLLDEPCRREDFDGWFNVLYSNIDRLGDVLKPYVLPAFNHYLLPWATRETGTRTQFMIDHLQMAFILGTVSLFVRGDETDLDVSGLDLYFVYRGSLWERPSGISLLDERFSKTIMFINYLLSQKMSLQEGEMSQPMGEKPSVSPAIMLGYWSSLVFKVILDMDQPHSASERLDSLTNHWGAQKNGLVVLSDFILQPSTRASSAYIYHSLRGHLLDIPTKEDRIIEGLSKIPKIIPTQIQLHSRDRLLNATTTPPPRYIDSLRLDLEPCWECDPGTCRFVLRAGGIPRLQLGISDLFRSVKTSPKFKITRIRCPGPNGICPGPESIFRLMLGYDNSQIMWSTLHLSDMIDNGWLGFDEFSNVSRNPDSRSPDSCSPESRSLYERFSNKPIETAANSWFINAYHSDILLMLALHGQDFRETPSCDRIVTDCLGAALLAQFRDYSLSTIIIMSHEKHNRLSTALPLDYNRREDCLATAAAIIAHDDLSQAYKSGAVGHIVSMKQLTNLIWQVPEDCDGHRYAEVVVLCLDHSKTINGITQEGILKVLQAIDISKVVYPVRSIETNQGGVAKTTEDLITKWQKDSFSASDYALMIEALERMDEEFIHAADESSTNDLGHESDALKKCLQDQWHTRRATRS